MEEKLTPLQALETIKDVSLSLGNILNDVYDAEINVIKTALKRLEEIDNSIGYGGGVYATGGIIDKKLKALEIIKNKKVDVSWLFSREVNDYIDYNVWSGAKNLTQEEYDLLKEVLK